MSKEGKQRFDILLGELANTLRLGEGDHFEVKGSRETRTGVQLKYEVSAFGSQASLAFGEVTGTAPKSPEIAILNEGVRASLLAVRGFLTPLDRVEGTPLEGSILVDLAMAFAMGAVFEAYESGVVAGETGQRRKLFEAFVEVGRRWATQAHPSNRGANHSTHEVYPDRSVMVSRPSTDDLSDREADEIARALREAAGGRSAGDA